MNAADATVQRTRGALPRALCDEIAQDAGGARAALHTELAVGAFVDVNRVLMPQEAVA